MEMTIVKNIETTTHEYDLVLRSFVRTPVFKRENFGVYHRSIILYLYGALCLRVGSVA